MERLETKQIHGQTYYYYSKWGWVDGKCRRMWQKYLGKLENIVKAVEGDGPAPLHAEVFQWGLPIALWKECEHAKVIHEGLLHATEGHYLHELTPLLDAPSSFPDLATHADPLVALLPGDLMLEVGIVSVEGVAVVQAVYSTR